MDVDVEEKLFGSKKEDVVLEKEEPVVKEPDSIEVMPEQVVGGDPEIDEPVVPDGDSCGILDGWESRLVKRVFEEFFEEFEDLSTISDMLVLLDKYVDILNDLDKGVLQLRRFEVLE